MSPVVGAVLGLLALVLAVAAIVLATIANRRWATRPRVVDRRGDAPTPAGDAHLQALRAQLDALTGQVDSLTGEVGVVTGQLDDLRGEVAAASGSADAAAALADAAATREARDRTALRHVALVRYDAFADVGGRLSHSVAILDDTRSGLVLTTLAGKADVRTYVRAVSAGTGEVPLTVEEQQAVDAAMAAPGATPAAGAAAPGGISSDPAPDPDPSVAVPTPTNGSRP